MSQSNSFRAVLEIPVMRKPKTTSYTNSSKINFKLSIHVRQAIGTESWHA